MKTKQVGYFYPTSPNSERFNIPEGGYSVSIILHEGTDRMKPPRPVAGFLTYEEAQRAAEALPYPYSRYTI